MRFLFNLQHYLLILTIILFRNKLNVKEAIDFIAEAWDNVTQTTIRNCWKKTGILPSSDLIVDDINMEDFELDELDEIDIDFLPEADNLRNYLEILDEDIPTEEHLTDEQILNLLQDEEYESENESEDEEVLIVSEKEEIEACKTLINYFEQQNDPAFSIDDLHIFKKYLRIIKAKVFNSKHQTTLDNFFGR